MESPTKRIRLVNGEVVSDASECRMWQGVARIEAMRGGDSFAALINGLSTQEFICPRSNQGGVQASAGRDGPGRLKSYLRQPHRYERDYHPDA